LIDGTSLLSESVSGRALATGSVGSRALRDGSVERRDLAPALLSTLNGTGTQREAVAGPTGPAGSVGPMGPTGATGARGPAGVDGAPGLAGSDDAWSRDASDSRYIRAIGDRMTWTSSTADNLPLDAVAPGLKADLACDNGGSTRDIELDLLARQPEPAIFYTASYNDGGTTKQSGGSILADTGIVLTAHANGDLPLGRWARIDVLLSPSSGHASVSLTIMAIFGEPGQGGQCFITWRAERVA
jgi:hypothetical protein